jgi:hypothetical protein
MQSTDENAEKAIANLLQKETGAKEIPADDYDRGISELVGIDGADAMDFLKKYSEQFHVDMTDFVYRKYFGNEGFDLAEVILNLVWKKHRYAPLSIRQLTTIAQAGKWPLEPDSQGIMQRAKIGHRVNCILFAAIAILILSRFF